MKCVVTGSKGFVGQYLVRRLLNEGFRVVEFDLPEHDLLTSDFSCLDGASVVFHLAAMKGIPACDADPIGALRVNVLGTARLLEACREKDIEFIYGSTWAVNSHNKKMYDVSKKAAEEVVLHYVKRKGVKGKILRLATIYGSGMAGDGVINKFARALVKGQSAEVYGDGWEIRQYTHITDIIEGLLCVWVNSSYSSTPYVVSAREVVSVNDLARRMGVPYAHVEAKDEDENYEVLKTNVSGWKQGVLLEDGLKEMLENAKEQE